MAGHRTLSTQQLTGRIHSVYCKDFVSYSEITFYPKHYLNVLTGPNGSGKSTIVSAIILGLGGEPHLLDRSASVADYIQSNKTMATIVVRVYGRVANTKESFRRIIHSNGSSTFSVNNNDMSKKNFLAAVSSYNIQVSNLCQFLPQDRVQDFSKMNPQELLLNTMSSVCDDELTNSFNELKQMRSQHSNTHANREKEKNELAKKQKRLEHLQMTVAQFKEREDVKKKLQIFSAKKLWVETQAGEEKVAQLKGQVKKAKTQSEKLKKEHNQLVQAQEEIRKKKDLLSEASLEKTRLLDKAVAEKNNIENQLDSLKQGIREKNFELKQNIQKSLRNATEADKVKQLVDNKTQELEDFNSSRPQILLELEKVKESCRWARDKAMEQYNRRKQLEQQLNDEKIPEITALKHKIDRLKNVKIKKIEEIGRRNPNLVTAMNWLAQNKHRYKLNVYDPMILELSIENYEDAKYLENVVSQRDLFAFACEDKEDMSDIISELCVKQKLGVNIIFCAPADRIMYSPSIPRNELRHMGFRAYLVDLVTGPIPLINKLCASYSIHNIPIGTDAVGNYTSSIPKSIRVYFGGNKKFVVTASRYRSDTILTESTIRGKNQLIAVDSQQLAQITKQCVEAIKESDNIKNAITRTDNEFERLQGLTKEEQEKKRKLDQKLSHFNNLKNEIELLMRRLESLQKSDGLEALKNNFNDSLQKDFKKLFNIEAKLCSSLKTLKTLMIEKKLAQTRTSVYMVQHESQSEALKESEQLSISATREFQKFLQCMEEQIADISKRKNDVQRLCDGEIPTSSRFPFKREFKELESKELPEIREAIHDFQARLECMKNVNSEAIDSYQQLQNEVKRLEEGITDSVNQAKTIESQMSNLYDKWEPKLTSLVETISTKFSEFMESIEYVGEVVLSKTDKFDFDSYGIQIMVQFRRGAQLQPLDKFIQSGGERAVSIAIYSLSLQHVTHVPFRCVDEINQGMDAKNERHIFDLLLKEATKHGSAQYLFVTPKLLRDLNYNEHLCVSIVHNSKTVCDGMKFPVI
ncbi:LOW QUALITY PROTEIN: structural maintenance of chromosomes protein 5 [Drosophila ficusphila]|uniref:LOW QUALITY PROTEIN: structural maintenance of chromosomes protein 5 n=1 Tax=Drosophila ficusphila TaxID=30025 RepID=UPI001C8A7ECD|nr:LOW QUALITY PROTEIN: structural maintenance of chromosomes protein 5 [Drosophila ficusphila]